MCVSECIYEYGRQADVNTVATMLFPLPMLLTPQLSSFHANAKIPALFFGEVFNTY